MPQRKNHERIHAAIDARFAAHLEACRRLLQQPSVSSTGEGVRDCAEMIAARLKALGAEVRFAGRPSHPIIYGRLAGGAPKTLIIYGMYDVQPVEPEGWRTPPFAAELFDHSRHGRCVAARGAVNSKGALAGLLNALDTIKAVEGRPPLNLIFILDGEEEIGSPALEPFIREHRDELQGDGVADFDFSEDARQNVTLHLGLKGIVYLELVCRGGRKGGPTEAQHSSASAWIASPVWRLVHALSTLTDARERITIDGFYDNVAPVSRRDQRLLRRLAENVDEEAFLREMKAICFKHRIGGVELLRRGLFLPIINIDGISAGYVGRGNKTVLPRRARVRLDVRFGPRMEPEEVVDKLRAHLARGGFDDIEVTVREAYSWSKTDAGEPLVQRLIQSYRHHGREPQVWPMATWTAPYFVFSRILGLPVVAGGLGFGDRAHSPNEYMTVEGLRDFEKWVVTFLYLFSR